MMMAATGRVGGRLGIAVGLSLPVLTRPWHLWQLRHPGQPRSDEGGGSTSSDDDGSDREERSREAGVAVGVPALLLPVLWSRWHLQQPRNEGGGRVGDDDGSERASFAAASTLSASIRGPHACIRALSWEGWRGGRGYGRARFSGVSNLRGVFSSFQAILEALPHRESSRGVV
jgi:hypothetical protein